MSSTRWPAEWEEQESIWFSWPHRDDTWSGDLMQLEKKFAKIINLTAKFQKVCINASEQLFDRIEASLYTIDNIELYNHPTNDVWCRDHGATFIEKNNQLHAIDWSYNAWGGKFPPWDKDDAIAAQMANANSSSHYRSPLHLEGGAIEGNGAGTVITTEAVALNPNRNPNWTREDVESELKFTLGANNLFWLANGIEGDDTDGHIDDLVRFIKEDAIVSIVETNRKSPNYSILQENLERLQDLKTSSGNNVEIIKLPTPDIIKADNWRLETLPASYANFLILNNAVLAPTFGQPKNDDLAMGILRECFHSRQVIGIDCRDLIMEGGAIHCLSQQIPKIR